MKTWQKFFFCKEPLYIGMELKKERNKVKILKHDTERW